MAKKESFTVTQVVEAVKKARGVASVTASLLGCHVTTLVGYRKKYKAVAQAFEHARETTLDFVESKLLEKIKEGDTTAMIFYLKTQGRERGYSEKTAVEHSGQITITRTIVHSK